MNYRDDDDDDDIMFEPFDCENCPLLRSQYRPVFGPPGGPPPFNPGGGPGGPGGGPGGPGGHEGPPMGPPPNQVPKQSQAKSFGAPGGGPSTFAIDSGAIRPCRHRFTYLWLRNGREFWAWPTYIGRNSLSGFRWNGFRWVFFGIDLRQIRSFVCR